MKKVIVLISFLCGAFFVSAQQGNQQQRQQERWKPESTEWYHPVPPKVTLELEQVLLLMQSSCLMEKILQNGKLLGRMVDLQNGL